MTVRIRSVALGRSMAGIMPGTWEDIASFYRLAEDAFGEKGYEVQTGRLVLDPLHPGMPVTRASLFSYLESVERGIARCPIRWVCLPLSSQVSWKSEDLFLLVPELIARFPFLFINMLITTDRKVNIPRTRDAAENILKTSRLSSNGYDTFRVGVGANIKPNTPFFPFTWHDDPAGFSLAVEVIGALIEAAERMPTESSLHSVLDEFERTLTGHCLIIGEAAKNVEKATGLVFKGMDISLAPFPDGRRSVAGLLERLGLRCFGDAGTLMLTAALSRLLKRVLAKSGIKAAGFNGVMYSPLEDHRLAEVLRRSSALTTDKFLLYSTVCGCGLDMIPIPGDTMPDDLAGCITDMATLSLALDKPLGLRLLPIPARLCNEVTDFNHDFLVNTRILSLPSNGVFERHIAGELQLL